MERPLTPEEAALWARVLETVRPIPKRAIKPTAEPSSSPPLQGRGKGSGSGAAGLVFAAALSSRSAKAALGAQTRAPTPKPSLKKEGSKESATLDGSWDKQLSRGIVSPDRTIDLHGHNLGSAYDLLDTALARAISDGDRVVLLITGKPPRAASERPHQRGAIRAAVGDWLAGSRHSANIAAVRGAHPRHGGTGALYIVLRRARSSSKS